MPPLPRPAGLERVAAIAATLEEARKIRTTRDAFLAADAFRDASQEAVEAVAAFQKYNPLAPGIPREALRERLDLAPDVFASILNHLVAEERLDSNRGACSRRRPEDRNEG